MVTSVQGGHSGMGRDGMAPPLQPRGWDGVGWDGATAPAKRMGWGRMGWHHCSSQEDGMGRDGMAPPLQPRVVRCSRFAHKESRSTPPQRLHRGRPLGGYRAPLVEGLDGRCVHKSREPLTMEGEAQFERSELLRRHCRIGFEAWQCMRGVAAGVLVLGWF